MNRRARYVGWLLGWTLVFVGSARIVWAQEDAEEPAREEDVTAQDAGTPEAEAAPEAGPEADRSETASTPASSPATGEGLVSVDFKDADVRQVLRVISLKSGVDIVAGSDVEGLVTIKLTNVPWEQALDIILRTYGFTYERKGNIVRVATIEAIEKEPLATEVFPLDYAKAKEVPDVIKEMLSDRGRVKFDERTNTIIVTDIPTNLFQIKQVVERLDTRTPQVLIETKVVETKLAKDEKLGIDWSDSMTLAASSFSLPSTFPFPGGADLGNFGSSFIPRSTNASSGAIVTKGRIPESTTSAITLGTLSSTGLSAVMNFLQSRTDTHIVSNPSISALNNQQASVHIGSEFPIPNYSIDPSTGRTTISGYTSKDIGTVLTVTPHINPSQEIVVELKPEVITFSSNRTYDTGGGFSVSLPEFTIQNATTQVRIQNNETIAIGGLVKETDTKTEAKVPFLGDLPIVGLLFKNVTRYGGSDPVRQDLLIFLTVKLIGETTSGEQSVAAASPDTPYP